MATDITHKPTAKMVDLTGVPEPVVEPVQKLVQQARQKQAEDAKASVREAAGPRPAREGHPSEPESSVPKDGLDPVDQEMHTGTFPRFLSDPNPTPQQFEHLLDEMAAMGVGQALPPDFSRADIYDDD
jgi:hypothetical protein